MKCYMKSSASSRHHDVDSDDDFAGFADDVLEFQDQYKALFARHACCREYPCCF